MKKAYVHFILILGAVLLTGGCKSSDPQVAKNLPYRYEAVEAYWIREGEPIHYDSELWYPQDDVEIFTDAEMILLGEYRNVQFFVERTDVRPFNRLYTKFSKNKFRFFEKDDPVFCDVTKKK